MKNGWKQILQFGIVKLIGFSIGPDNAEHGEIILYFKNGKPFHPPINAYDGFNITTTNTEKQYRISYQKLGLKDLCRLELEKYHCNAWVFPPSVKDVRSFTWNNWNAEPGYTYIIDFKKEFKPSEAVRKQINKALRSGYTCVKKEDWESILYCLKDTEKRQNFHYGLDIIRLKKAIDILGEDCFRCYVCYGPDGEPASARIVIWPGFALAYDWVAGTSNSHLQSGATQQIIYFVLNDLLELGCDSFDFCGANIPSVQSQKAEWGGELRTYFRVYRQTPLNALMDFAKIIKREVSFRMLRSKG